MTDDERALLILTATSLAGLLNDKARKTGETSKAAQDLVTLLRRVAAPTPMLVRA